MLPRRLTLNDPLPHSRSRILETRTRSAAALAAVAPVVGLALGYVALSLLDLWSRVPPLVHLLVFICLVVVVVGGLAAAVRAYRRLHATSGIRWGRYALLLPLLTVALVLAGQDWQRRLVVAFRPGLLFPPPQMQITATITPPAYTRLAPITLPTAGDRAGAPLKVPAGSVLRVEAQATRWPPLLAWGKEAVVLRPESDGSYAIEGELKADGKVRVTYAGKTIVRWMVDVIPDRAPTIRLTAKPGASARKSLRLAIDAEDDHGIEFLALRIKRADGSGVDHVVDLPAYGTPRLNETLYRDLTADPLAGEEVTLTVVALDGLSQEAETSPVTLTLPKRTFRNPLALSLVATRTGLMTGEPEDVEQAIRRLGTLSEQPVMAADATIHLGLRTAFLRLKSGATEEQRKDVADLLWDLALRAEDGTRSITENELAEALDNTLMMVRKKSAPEQVQGALGSLAAAFENYGRARVDGRVDGGAGVLGDRDAIDWGAVQRLFVRLNDLAGAGDYDSLAQQIVSLRSGIEEQPDLLLSASAYRHFMVATYARRLIDEVRQQQQQLSARASGPAPAAPLALADDQSAIRDALSALITQLARAGIPDLDPFLAARAAMDQAVVSLTAAEPARITESQARVMAALDAAAQSLEAFPAPVMPDANGNYQDPLGRPLPSGLEGKGNR